MKAKDIREMNPGEIAQRIKEEQEEYLQLKFQHAIAEIQNPMLLRHKRRLIARLQTVLKQMEAAA